MSTQRIIKHHTHTVCSKCSCFAICSLRSLSMPCDRFIPHGVDSNLHCLQTIRELYSTTIATKTRTVCRFISFNCFSFFIFQHLFNWSLNYESWHALVCFFLSSCSILVPISIWFCWMFELASFDYLQEKSFASF